MSELPKEILRRILHGEKLVYEGLKVNTNEAKPLHALPDGVVVLVGVKASNFDDEIKNHPRVVMWNSLNENWMHKELPSNTRAVFMTRFIGHAAFNNIVKEARKRHITIFNPQGTGLIAKQVKQLLNIDQPIPAFPTGAEYNAGFPTKSDKTTEPKVEVTTMPKAKTHGEVGKLKPLHQFIDHSKSVIENADILLQKAKELGIETTRASVAQMMYVMRRKATTPTKKVKVTEIKTTEKMDVSVEVLNNIIKELQDMRDFINDTVAENTRLRVKVDKFKKFFDE